MKIIFIIASIYVLPLFSQDTTTAQVDSLNLFKGDTLGLKLSYPVDRQLPKDIINIPQPKSPLEIDTRTGSYYTPKNVQDKMDDIMNRPRSDSFVPLLGLAAFAVSVAAKQLEAAKLFEPKAEDYLLAEKELLVLEQLWKKAPQRIDDLYLNTSLKDDNTAKELQKTIVNLTDINLVKTRSDGNELVLFFPAQKLEHVKKIIQAAAFDTERPENEIQEFKFLINRFEKLNISPEKTE